MVRIARRRAQVGPRVLSMGFGRRAIGDVRGDRQGDWTRASETPGGRRGAPDGGQSRRSDPRRSRRPGRRGKDRPEPEGDGLAPRGAVPPRRPAGDAPGPNRPRRPVRCRMSFGPRTPPLRFRRVDGQPGVLPSPEDTDPLEEGHGLRNGPGPRGKPRIPGRTFRKKRGHGDASSVRSGVRHARRPTPDPFGREEGPCLGPGILRSRLPDGRGILSSGPGRSGSIRVLGPPSRGSGRRTAVRPGTRGRIVRPGTRMEWKIAVDFKRRTQACADHSG